MSADVGTSRGLWMPVIWFEGQQGQDASREEVASDSENETAGDGSIGMSEAHASFLANTPAAHQSNRLIGTVLNTIA